MDKSISDIMNALDTITKTMDNLYIDEEYDMYEVLGRYVFAEDNCDYLPFRRYLANASDLKSYLETHNDTIRDPEEVMTLEDYGYKKDWSSDRSLSIWTKDVVDHEDETITDQIVYGEDIDPKRRTIDILWKTVPYGRESKSITYSNNEIDSKLSMAIKNSIEEDLKKQAESI